jgi:hypothetical protein
MVKERAAAVVVQGSLAFKSLADMAIKYRLPTASTTRSYADVGGLMAFGADGPASVRHGAKFVHRILQGKQPKDLPIEQPMKYELAHQPQDCESNRPQDSQGLFAARRRGARLTWWHGLRTSFAIGSVFCLPIHAEAIE